MRVFLCMALLMCHAAPASAETILIVKARILTMSSAGEINPGSILIRDGKIAEIGRNINSPASARIVDAEGNIVTPGIIDPGTSLGLFEIFYDVAAADDRGCTAQCANGAFDVQYGINPDSVLFAAARLGGVTRAVVIPHHSDPHGSVFSGHAAAIQMGEGSPLLTDARIAMLAEFGEAGAAKLGGARSGALQSLRTKLHAAKALAPEKRVQNDVQRAIRAAIATEEQALIPVVEGRIPLVVSVHRKSDIRNVLLLAQDYDLKLVLFGAEDAWRLAEEIAEQNVPVILSATQNRPNSFEKIGSTMSNAAVLHKAGVTIAIQGNGPDRVREIRHNAGNAVANGLPWKAALEAITRNPASIFNLEGGVGVIQPGADADLVIWDGDPLEILTTPRSVFIRGKEQPLESRGTKLRDRYMNLQRTYPAAYH